MIGFSINHLFLHFLVLVSMELPSSFFCLLLFLALVSGNLLTADDRTTRRPGKGEPEEGRIQNRQQRSISECQEGNPMGSTYSGKLNVTTSGRTCQVWTTSEPHEHSDTAVGEHNYCRNPFGDPEGVYCYTTDPEKRWEYCSVPVRQC